MEEDIEDKRKEEEEKKLIEAVSAKLQTTLLTKQLKTTFHNDISTNLVHQ